MTKRSFQPNPILKSHSDSGETKAVESVTITDADCFHRQGSREGKLGLVVANGGQKKIPDTGQFGHLRAQCRSDLERPLDVSFSTDIGAQACVVDVTARAHNERVSPECRSQFKSHRIHAHRVVRTVAMN